MSIGVRIQWLGHSTFLFTAGDGTTLLVEPFVDSNPACPDECRDLGRVDVVACTHAHGDHVGDVFDIVERTSPKAVVAAVELTARLKAGGVPGDLLVDTNKGGTVNVCGIDLTMVDANHSSGYDTGEDLVYAGEPAGFVFGFPGGGRVYHAGDTNVFSDMALIAELYEPDVVLLPIGDRYTMGPREAAKACELLGARRVIPMHWGTWPILTGTPDALRSECDRRGLDVEVIDVEPGGVWE